MPEPPLIVYGTLPQDSVVEVSVHTEGDIELLRNLATSIEVDGQHFYLAEIPMESRALPHGRQAATPGTLELTSQSLTICLWSVAGGTSTQRSETNLVISDGQRGYIVRLDPTAQPPETYEEWSERIFGSVQPRDGDSDGDGVNDYSEYVAGTDPKSAGSHLGAASVRPLGSGMIRIEWPTVGGRVYQLVKAGAPDATTWCNVGDPVAGTGAVVGVTDTLASGEQTAVYRIKVSRVPAPGT
ncbi:MAG: hypothetical protein Fur0032_11690 [Terrimicrobiaceae bacterium]